MQWTAPTTGIAMYRIMARIAARQCLFLAISGHAEGSDGVSALPPIADIESARTHRTQKAEIECPLYPRKRTSSAQERFGLKKPTSDVRFLSPNVCRATSGCFQGISGRLRPALRFENSDSAMATVDNLGVRSIASYLRKPPLYSAGSK